MTPPGSPQGASDPSRTVVGIVGLGLIGGSLGAALRRAAGHYVLGWDELREHSDVALGQGLVDDIAADLSDLARRSQILVLAVPVSAANGVAQALQADCAPDVIVTDVGSVKCGVSDLEAVFPGRFLGGHPIAGLERSGPAAADPTLFTGRLVVLTPSETTDPRIVQVVEALWTAAGARRVLQMSPADHDSLCALFSHLPHVAAFALAGTLVAEAPERLELSQEFAFRSFADVTRIARSSPALWADILWTNRIEVLALARRLRRELLGIEADLEARSRRPLEARLDRARSALLSTAPGRKDPER